MSPQTELPTRPLCWAPAACGPRHRFRFGQTVKPNPPLEDRPAAPALEDQGDDEQHEEDEQENLRDVGEVTHEAAETEHTGDQGEDGKDHSPAEHGALVSPLTTLAMNSPDNRSRSSRLLNAPGV